MPPRLNPISLFCIFLLLLIPAHANSQSKQPPPPPKKSASTPPAKKLTPADVLIIKGTLLGNDGAPLAGKTVLAFPVNTQGTPLSILIMIDGSLVSWHPKATTDALGRFSISMPRVTAIGDEQIAEAAIGIVQPAGGVVTAQVLKIHYAGPNREAEAGMIRIETRLPTLRSGELPLRVRLDDPKPSVDLGKIILP